MDYSSTFVSSNYASTPMRAQQAEIILARFMPPSSSQSDIPIHLSTYTPGEDFGRLAKLAKEFGLARIRNQKKQIRKGIPKLAITNGQQQQQQQPSHERQPALRYIFSGYSIWLELEQQEINNNGIGDLEFAVKEAADEFHLGGAIPAPHVTALYGITTIETDEEAINIFRNDVVKAITNRAEKVRKESTGNSGKLWPDLAATGIIVGAEYDGVNGGEMDMAWTEISFATSPEHESLISELYDIFYRRDATRLAAANASLTDEKKEEYPPRSQPWVPNKYLGKMYIGSEEEILQLLPLVDNDEEVLRRMVWAVRGRHCKGMSVEEMLEVVKDPNFHSECIEIRKRIEESDRWISDGTRRTTTIRAYCESETYCEISNPADGTFEEEAGSEFNYRHAPHNGEALKRVWIKRKGYSDPGNFIYAKIESMDFFGSVWEISMYEKEINAGEEDSDDNSEDSQEVSTQTKRIVLWRWDCGHSSLFPPQHGWKKVAEEESGDTIHLRY